MQDNHILRSQFLIQALENGRRLHQVQIALTKSNCTNQVHFRGHLSKNVSILSNFPFLFFQIHSVINKYFLVLLSSLQVNIISCRDLPELLVASNGQCLLEPYVKLQLLPEKQHRVKTRLVRASRNPQYDEVFSMYGMDRLQLATTSLHFAVRFSSLILING